MLLSNWADILVLRAQNAIHVVYRFYLTETGEKEEDEEREQTCIYLRLAPGGLNPGITLVIPTVGIGFLFLFL